MTSYILHSRKKVELMTSHIINTRDEVELMTSHLIYTREEVERMTERTSSSRDALLCELQSKECELVDAMMIVSLLQEQIKDTTTQDKVGEVLSEIKERNQLAPKLNFLQAGEGLINCHLLSLFT